jgi:PAS domain S-box-containing protein
MLNQHLTATGEDPPRTAPPALPERLTHVLDHAVHFIAILDRTGTILDMNRPATALRGRRREDVVGESAWRLEPDPEGARALRERIERAASGEHVVYRTITNRANGGVELEVSIKPVPDATGDVAFLLMECRDITESMRAEQELQVAKEKFAGIINLSADAIISVDSEFRIIDFNHGAEKIFGYAAEEILGQPLDLLIPAKHRGAHRHHVRAFGDGNVTARRMGERREISGVRKDGQEFPADASISKQDVAGKRIYTVVMRDITSQKRAETMQRFLAQAGTILASSLDITATYESVARLATEHIADACVFFLQNAQGRVQREMIGVRNPMFEEFAKRYRPEWIDPDSPHPVIQVLRTRRALLLRDLVSALSEAERSSADMDFLRALEIRSAIFVPLVARGQITGAVGLFRRAEMPAFTSDDVADAEEFALTCALAADNARLYRDTMEAVRARDDILAVVSHDLGNPLSAIRIGVSLLLRNAPTRELEGGWEHLAGIKHSVEQMERLIRDLLEIKRIEAGQMTMALEPIRPAILIASVEEMLSPLADGKSIEIRSRIEPSLPHIKADRERMIQVLSNLIGNSIKFTQPGGHVELRADVVENEVLFSVSDNGPGIDASDIEHVFDRFWQARRSRHAGTSLGLGLAIVKGIVEAHGGRVWAESVIGNGTTIRFTLPLAHNSATQAA